MTRAKFYVVAVNEDSRLLDSKEVVLEAVTSGSEDNKSFWQYTPSGQIRMSITNKKALDLFVQGKEYYVDFSEAS